MRFLIISTLLITLFQCNESKANQPIVTEKGKTAVLLVNHGSHSKTWRNMLLDLEEKVKPDLLSMPEVDEVRTAFMEYNEPSIANRLKEFDQEGYDEVLIVPIFITVSSHSLDDIPVIAGMKVDPNVTASLAEEKIETYTPKARVRMTPTLDIGGFLKQNILRRMESTMKSETAGLVMVAYGDAAYNQQWETLLQDIGSYAQLKGKSGAAAFSWCGHLVHYSKQPTIDAIHQVLEVEEQVVVVPVLVAYDEDFQVKIIQEAINDVNQHDKVFYSDDAILPDPVLENWVLDSVKSALVSENT